MDLSSERAGQFASSLDSRWLGRLSRQTHWSGGRLFARRPTKRPTPPSGPLQLDARSPGHLRARAPREARSRPPQVSIHHSGGLFAAAARQGRISLAREATISGGGSGMISRWRVSAFAAPPTRPAEPFLRPPPTRFACRLSLRDGSQSRGWRGNKVRPAYI